MSDLIPIVGWFNYSPSLLWVVFPLGYNGNSFFHCIKHVYEHEIRRTEFLDSSKPYHRRLDLQN